MSNLKEMILNGEQTDRESLLSGTYYGELLP